MQKMLRCKKCFIMKITDKSDCLCNIKKFDEKKLSKQTRVEKKPKAIKQVSEKKAKQIKERWSLDNFYQKLSKKHFDKDGNWVCEYCKAPFNIQYDVINQRTCFAHILDKWDPLYRHLAVFNNNVAIVCGEKCHKDMDAEICTLILKPTLQKLIEDWKKINVSDLNQYI